MNPNGPATKHLSPEDKAILKKLQSKAWFTYLRLYLPLFLMLAYVYYTMQPGKLLEDIPSSIPRRISIRYSHILLLFLRLSF